MAGRTPEEESAARVEADEAAARAQAAADTAASNARTAADDKRVQGEVAVDDARQIVRDAEQRGLSVEGPKRDFFAGVRRAARGMSAIANTAAAVGGRAARVASGASEAATPHAAKQARSERTVQRAAVLNQGFA